MCPIFLLTYSAAQLQGNVCMGLECMRDASGMHAGHVWDACEMYPERAQDASMQAQNLTIHLQQDLHNCHAFFFPERVQNTSGTHANVTLELSCTI